MIWGNCKNDIKNVPNIFGKMYSMKQKNITFSKISGKTGEKDLILLKGRFTDTSNLLESKIGAYLAATT